MLREYSVSHDSDSLLNHGFQAALAIIVLCICPEFM